MSAILVSLALWLNPYAIQEWANNYVNAKNLGHGGSYDECLQKAYSIQTTGRALQSNEPYKSTFTPGDFIPQGLGDEYSDGQEGTKLMVACAVVLHGGEF